MKESHRRLLIVAGGLGIYALIGFVIAYFGTGFILEAIVGVTALCALVLAVVCASMVIVQWIEEAE